VTEIEMIEMIGAEMTVTTVAGSGVITGTGTHDTTPIQTQTQTTTTVAGITGMAEAREM
jgi:hypothetical protein